MSENKEPKYKIIFIIVVACFFTLLIGVYLVIDYMGNTEQISYEENFPEFDKNRIYITLYDNTLVEYNPIMSDGKLYIPIDFIKMQIDKYIFWDEQYKILIMTTSDKIYRFTADSTEYFMNGEKFSSNLPLKIIDKAPYLPMDTLLSLYDINAEYIAETNRLIIDFSQDDRTEAVIKATKANVRYEPTKKSFIAYKAVKGEAFTVLSQSDSEYTQVRTKTGLIGYIQSKTLDNSYIIEGVKKEEINESISSEKLTILWDQVFNDTANMSEDRRIYHEGVDVLSPTWFSFDPKSEDAVIKSLANLQYVEWAHEMNYEVWGLITDNFDEDISHMVLIDTNTRERVINQLLDYAKDFKLDGINIDFEMVKYDDAGLFIQFLRELYPMAKKNGLTISVDTYVPKSFNLYYNRTEIANASDYVIIMGYDEHWATSPTAGPVASIGFAEEGIIGTLLEVPKEKIILGVPFFTRVWTVNAETGKVKNEAKGMQTSYDFFINNGSEFIWLEDKGCYYSEFDGILEGEAVKYMVWLEDERSLIKKLELITQYDIAGVACWKRGMQKNTVWEIIDDYVY